MFPVCATRGYFKIFNPIVGLDAVFVMYDFAAREDTAQVRLDYEA